MHKFVHGMVVDYEMYRYLLLHKNLVSPHGVHLKWQGFGGKIQNKNILTRPESEVLAAIPGSSQHINKDESPHEAMVREFQEEANYEIKKNRWHCFLVKEYKDQSKIYFFVAFASPDEMVKMVVSAMKTNNTFPVEGEVSIHQVEEIARQQEQYTFDIHTLITFIHRENKAGMLMQLDPEGINSSGKNT